MIVIRCLGCGHVWGRYAKGIPPDIHDLCDMCGGPDSTIYQPGADEIPSH